VRRRRLLHRHSGVPVDRRADLEAALNATLNAELNAAMNAISVSGRSFAVGHPQGCLNARPGQS
ncbi:hypothetical protein, partial [Achromobacter insuavis]|uniref:hypothetical protein n=1 Tax=Achromobacter insuavis TaxID=1287735 RepID=UPI0035A097C0